jgi:formylglycine-generating enzyme required for sulfatase activity
MAGNVWEWAASAHASYPAESGKLEEGTTTGMLDVPVRGGSWSNDSTFVRCRARDWDLLRNRFRNLCFRMVVAPRAL